MAGAAVNGGHRPGNLHIGQAAHPDLTALLLCGADRADRVMIAGQWRVIDGQVEGLDLKGLIADHSQAARQLIAGT